MNSLYALIADPEWAEILTLLTVGGIALAWLSFIWGNAKQQNIRLTTFDWGCIYALGFVTFMCGVIILGNFIVPANAKSLLETLHLDGILRYLTVRFQTLLLSLLRPLL
ncbi:MAG: hypothetical protein ACOYXC_05955 [Candidatus Rifleibacteriota bacterium]